MRPKLCILDAIFSEEERAAVLMKMEALLQPITECGCMVTTGSHDGNYYGKFKHRNKDYMFHRAYFEVKTGTRIPPGHVLDHTCKVHSCSREDHLDPVTQAVNVERGDAVMYGSYYR